MGIDKRNQFANLGFKGIGKNFAKTLAQAKAASVGILDWDGAGVQEACNEFQRQFPETNFIPYQVVYCVHFLRNVYFTPVGCVTKRLY